MLLTTKPAGLSSTTKCKHKNAARQKPGGVFVFDANKPASASVRNDMRHHKKRAWTIRALAAALLLTVLASGASLAQNAARRAARHPATSTLLVYIRGTGGRTANGLYQMTTTIRRDGTIFTQDNDGRRTARLAPQETARLAALIRQADFQAIRASKRLGLPPSASDGRDLTYTFSTSHGPQTVTNTRTNINLQHPLFAALDVLLAKYARS